MLADIAGKLTIDDQDKTRHLLITDGEGEEKDYSVSRRMQLMPGVVDGAEIELGQQLTKGSVNPHDLLHLKGPAETLRYIVDQVQDVYRSQGVDINDKHIEVISRQMLRKISITEAGDAGFLPGAFVDRFEFMAANESVLAEGGEPANGHPVLLGITKASLATDSFLSAASFQETTRVLTDAAIAGKEDELLGLKENVIIGKLIPAATGMRRYRDVKLTYKGQNIEAETAAVEGPLPDWAPEELKEIEALLPVRPEPQPEELFGDFDFDDAGDIDVSAFTGVTFDPTAEVIGDAFDEEIVLEEIIAAPAEKISGDLESVTLGEIGVSTRWVNKFVEAGVTSVADLKGKSEDDLLNLPGIGQKAVEEVRAGLETHGLVNLLV